MLFSEKTSYTALQCFKVNRFCIMSIHAALDGKPFVLGERIGGSAKDQDASGIRPVSARIVLAAFRPSITGICTSIRIKS